MGDLELSSRRIDMLVEAGEVYRVHGNREEAQDHLPRFFSVGDVHSATYTLQVRLGYNPFSPDGNTGEHECKCLIMAVVGYKCPCFLWGWQRERCVQCLPGGVECQPGCPGKGFFKIPK
tara:strand:- start:188 stop:544 length:357 start_codon:yes stop_codon:yes gene_type:complete